MCGRAIEDHGCGWAGQGMSKHGEQSFEHERKAIGMEGGQKGRAGRAGQAAGQGRAGVGGRAEQAAGQEGGQQGSREGCGNRAVRAGQGS